MAVLYRKYRPQTFAEVLNQKPIIQTLKNQIISGAVAHAYLFTGGRGVGKTSVARILAKAVNCKQTANSKQQTAGDACGVCDFCKQIEAGNFIDLAEIDAASNTGVDNIRELIEHVKFAPSLGKYKVFIIDEVHMLSKGAFNALLKTLEEPPKHAIFILATTEINKVPATIISRSQRFDFKAYTAEDLMPHLEKIVNLENVQIGKDVLQLVAEAALGSVRDSLSLLGKVLTLGDNPEIQQAQALLGVTDIATCENLLELMAAGKAKDLPDFFDKISESAIDFKILNRDFLEFLRKVLVYKLADEKSGMSSDRLARLAQVSEALSVADVMFFIRLFLRSYKDLESAPNGQVCLLLSAIEGALKKSEVRSQKSEVSAQLVLKTVAADVIKPSAVVANNQKSPSLDSKTIENQSGLLSETQLYASGSESELTFGEVELLFPKAIAKIKEVNGPLSSVLRGAKLLEPKKGRVVAGVKFLFDKQNLENPKNLRLIMDVLTEVFQKPVGFLAEVYKEEKNELNGAAGLAEALQVFGGELVE